MKKRTKAIIYGYVPYICPECNEDKELINFTAKKKFHVLCKVCFDKFYVEDEKSKLRFF